MAEEILRRYAVGGAARPDSFSGLTPQFSGSLAQLFQAAPPDVQSVLRISSAYRSPERQQQLYDAALAKYGSEEAARKWVAPPGRSNHNHGQAVDLKFLSPAAREWVHKNAGQYGLAFPMAHEPWHVEPVDARRGGAGGAQPAMQPGTSLPMMAQAGAPQPVTPGFQMADPAAAAPMLGPSPIAAMFALDEQTKQKQALEKQAEQTRRAALFGGPSPFG